MDAAKLIPMAFVMIAGPQILSAIFLATSEDWRRNSIAYVAGAFLSITGIVTAAFFLSNGASNKGRDPSDTIDVVVLVLLVLAALYTFLNRKESQPPKWMGKLEAATPGFSFKLGFLLLGVFPTDILTSVAVGSYLGNHNDSWWHYLPFVAVTMFFLALPMLLIFVVGDRAQAFLPKARDWMNDNSWIVSEIVIGLFVLITINSIAG